MVEKKEWKGERKMEGQEQKKEGRWIGGKGEDDGKKGIR